MAALAADTEASPLPTDVEQWTAERGVRLLNRAPLADIAESERLTLPAPAHRDVPALPGKDLFPSKKHNYL